MLLRLGFQPLRSRKSQWDSRLRWPFTNFSVVPTTIFQQSQLRNLNR